MTIEYWAPLVRAWERMKVLLFRPFSLRKWAVIAFCAWLASLLEGSGGGHGGFDGGGPAGPVDVRGALEALRAVWARLNEAWQWILGHWGATLVVFLGIPLLVALILALVWISSRFKLIYLDNVVHGRALVAEPWGRLGHLGDSLWLFRVLFGVAVFVIGALLVALMVTLGVVTFTAESKGLSIGGLIVGGLTFTIFGAAVVYAALFLDAFVVPIMYRYNVSAVAAWRIFLAWLSAEPVSFFVYGLFVLVLFVVAGMTICVVGFATCCVAFLLLAIPYVGTVLLLPLVVAYRYLSLEFLAQFDPRLDLFAPRLPNA